MRGKGKEEGKERHGSIENREAGQGGCVEGREVEEGGYQQVREVG